jgi:hypothetical protein
MSDEDDFEPEPAVAKKPRKERRRRASVSNEAMAINEAIKKSKLVAKKRVVKKSRKTAAKKKVKAGISKISGVLNGPSNVLGKALVWLATVEAVIMLTVAVVAALQTTQSSNVDVAFMLMGFVSTFIGTSGVTRGNRELLMLYFVLLVWSIARLTNSITNNMVERVRMSALCRSTLRAIDVSEQSDDCDEQLVLLTANITLSAITTILVVISAWLAMRDSEKIQEEKDEADAAEKERVKTVMAVMQSRSKSVARRNSKFAGGGSFRGATASSEEGSFR